jgi:hypothetical protein
MTPVAFSLRSPQWLLYPRGATGGRARAAQRRAPHLLQRSRRVTSGRLASQPQTLASDRGSIRRSCPQPSHFKISSYCPNSSESFSTLNPRRTPHTLAPVGCEYPRDNSYSIAHAGELDRCEDLASWNAIRTHRRACTLRRLCTGAASFIYMLLNYKHIYP